ncbi:putative long-chain-alcohol O-fatty-acyltransferase 4 [Raphanus sativus]|nr:putative long-chain-alcohol O-fatty-acyltransferase 4 [Raphanus sativus]
MSNELRLGYILAVLATFTASGVAHEVFFFTLTFEMPTGEVTCFFVLHGVCTAAEVAVKRTAFGRRWVVSPVLSRLLTVGFVVVTSGWLLFPTAARSDMLERLANEALLSIDYVKRTFYTFG